MSARGTKTKKVLAVLLAGAVIYFVALSIMFPAYDWHVKYTVTVDTPSGERAASSVVEMGYRYFPEKFILSPGFPHHFYLSGEAVVVDLGGGRYLFTLTVRNGMEYLPFEALARRFGLSPGAYRELAPKIDRFRGEVALPRRLYPLLVTFDDINDPKTVRRVDPDDLAATFGFGYRLKSITIEITDEPVTRGKVEKVLGWLGKYPETGLGPATGRAKDVPLYSMFTHGDFIRR